MGSNPVGDANLFSELDGSPEKVAEKVSVLAPKSAKSKVTLDNIRQRFWPTRGDTKSWVFVQTARRSNSKPDFAKGTT